MSIELYELIGLSPQLEIKNFKVFLKEYKLIRFELKFLNENIIKKN